VFSENVANQETDELATVERDVVEAFGEDGSHDISQEQLDVAPTSFVEPEMDNTLQVDSLLRELSHRYARIIACPLPG